MRMYSWKQLMIGGAAAALMVSGCSQLSSITDRTGDVSERAGAVSERASDVSERASEAQEAVEERSDDPLVDARPELTQNERSAIQRVEMLEDDCPAEAAFYDGDDLSEDAHHYFSERQQRLSSCERNVLQSKPRLESVDAVHHTNPRYIAAAEYIEAMEAGLPTWRDTLEDEMFASQELRALGNKYNSLLGTRSPISGLIVELWNIKNGEEPEEYTRINVERIKEHAENAIEPCENEFLTSEETFTTFEEDNALHPTNACHFAMNWQDYTVHYLTLEGVNRVEGYYEDMVSRAEDIREDGRFHESTRVRMTDMPAAMQDNVERTTERFAHADATLPDEVQAAYDRLNELEANYQASYADAITVDRWDPQFNGKHSDVQSSLRSVVGSTDFSLVDYALYNSDGQIRYEMGNPVARTHTGNVLVSAGDHCRIYRFTAVAQYDGSGYQSPGIGMSIANDLYILTKCP